MNIMDWKECEKEHIRKVSIDKEKIESILETALQRQKFIESAKAIKENISFIIEGYYEIIKELLVAFLLSKGIKSDNHQCLISYFNKQYPEYEFETNLILQMNYLRNRLNYYGEQIDTAFYDKNKEEFRRIIHLLNSIIKKST